MKWLKGQIAPLLTSIVLLIGVGATYGRLDSRQASLERSLSAKVDRELDQVHRELANIQRPLDGVIIRQAIVADE